MVHSVEDGEYKTQQGVAAIRILDGKIYVATAVKGKGNIHVADVADDKFELLSKDLPTDNYPLSISYDGNENLYFTYIAGLAFNGTSGGIYKYNIADGKVTNVSPADNAYGNVYADKNNPDKLVTRTCVLFSPQWYSEEWTEDMYFDTVCEFIGFVPEHIERDYRLFGGRTNQYIFISSASAYHKPASNYIITEGTTLANPHWQYSRNKIACEELLMKLYRENNFPVTIVRPSHTYDENNIPLGVHGKNGFWQVVKRIREQKPVIIQGDGTSLWTLTFNTDFAVGFVGLIGNPHAKGEAFHITSDESLSWNQIYETIANALGVPLHPYHIASEFLSAVGPEYDFEGSLTGDKSVSVVFDNSKLKRVVSDFRPTVSFAQGVRIALDNILANPQLQNDDPEFDAWCDNVIAALEKAKTCCMN